MHEEVNVECAQFFVGSDCTGSAVTTAMCVPPPPATTRLPAFIDKENICTLLDILSFTVRVPSVHHERTNEVCSATPTIWEAAALGKADRLSHACLESSRSPKDRSNKPWSCPGVNAKSPGLGFTPLHACMAGIAACTRRLDVSRPCTPPRPFVHRRGKIGVASQPSLYTVLAREPITPADRGGRCGIGRKSDLYCPVLTGEQGCSANRADDHLRTCRILLSAAADVNALDARCRTPLALAAASGSLLAVEMLLQAGADPQASDADGNTPVHFALAYANAAIAAVLAKEGADLESRNGDGKTPQDVAGLCALVAPC